MDFNHATAGDTHNFSCPNRDVERQLVHLPIVVPVTLPNLRHFVFHGVSTYLDALAHQIATPRIEKFPIDSTQIFHSTSPAVYEHNIGPQVRQCPIHGASFCGGLSR